MNRPAFFSALSAHFGPLDAGQVHGLDFLLDRLEADPPECLEQAAYLLATIKHETADTYAPVREACFLKVKDPETWRRKNLPYWPWYGRGFVQITWRKNYERLGRALGVDLITDPDVALEPATAYRILRRGMVEGLFTGANLRDCVRPGYVNYLRARRVVNGSDKAALIAEYAKHFDAALRSAHYAMAKPQPAEVPA